MTMITDRKDPNAPSAVPDPDNPSEFLTNQRWDELWDEMTERRKEEARKYRRSWILPYQDSKEHKKMLTALLSGENAWDEWQEKNPDIKHYDFQYLDFCHDLYFYMTKFKKHISFEGAKFAKKVEFHDVEFAEPVNFMTTTFADLVNFNNVEFVKRANFIGTTFAKRVDFTKTKFAEEVSFIQTEFIAGADFRLAKFIKEASFVSATFTRHAHFQQATFAEEVDFLGARFADKIDFQQARFKSSGFFNEVKFDGDIINFSKIILSSDSNLIFENAKFKNALPDFRYISRIPYIAFHGFSVPAPDELIEQKKWDKDNESRYRKLKELAIGNDNQKYELKFYGYEMDSKFIYFNKGKGLGNKKWWKFYRAIKKIFYNINKLLDILLAFLYKISSNYGQTTLLPLIWLAVLAFIAYKQTPDLVSIVKTLLPLPLFVYDFESKESIGDIELFIKIFSTMFLFLFFLGVRNRFKIK